MTRIAVGILALSACASLSARGGVPQVFDQIVVNVNGDILTRRQLQERVRSVLAQQEGRAIAGVEVESNPDLRRRAAALTPPVAAAAIDQLLLLQRARALGFEATDDDVDRVVARMRLDSKIQSDEEFAVLLLAQGIQAAALRESVRNQILVEQVRQDLFGRVEVTESDARAYYQVHARDLTGSPAVAFSEIVVEMPPLESTRTSASAAREYDQRMIRFVAALDRVTRGEDFGVVARALSDAASKEAGGAVGAVDPRTLPEPLRAALAGLAAGQVSAPVRTDQGYRLLKLDRVTTPRPATFAAFRDTVMAQILSSKQAAAFAVQLKRLRGEAVIAWKDVALKAACEALLAVAVIDAPKPGVSSSPAFSDP